MITKDTSGRESSKIVRVLKFLRVKWVLVVAAFSIVMATLGWIIYDVSPLHPVREIALRQEQETFRHKLIQRHLSLGNDFLSIGQLDAARYEFNQVKELDPYNIEAWFGLLKAAVFQPIDAKDYDPEIAHRRLSAILDERPDDSHALAFLGEVYRTIDEETALSYYKKALENNPGNATAYFGKGAVYDRQGKTDEAIAMYKKASDISPWNQTFLNNLAYQHYLRGEYYTAESLYLLLLRLDGRFLLSYYMLANTQLMLGDQTTAKKNLLNLEELIRYGSTFDLPRNRGGWLFHLDLMPSITFYSQQEKIAYARYLMGLTEFLNGNIQVCRNHIEEVKKLDLTTEQLYDVLFLVWDNIEELKKSQPGWVSMLTSFEVLIQ